MKKLIFIPLLLIFSAFAEPTAYKNGALVTSTTTEVGITITGSRPPGVVTVILTVVSGSLQATVAPKATVFSPVIDSGFTTWDTADDKFLLTFDPVVEEIRMKGVATFSINW